MVVKKTMSLAETYRYMGVLPPSDRCVDLCRFTATSGNKYLDAAKTLATIAVFATFAGLGTFAVYIAAGLLFAWLGLQTMNQAFGFKIAHVLLQWRKNSEKSIGEVVSDAVAHVEPPSMYGSADPDVCRTWRGCGDASNSGWGAPPRVGFGSHGVHLI